MSVAGGRRSSPTSCGPARDRRAARAGAGAGRAVLGPPGALAGRGGRVGWRRAATRAELVDEVCDWLEGLGYVDDERYAAAFARQKRAAGWGARASAANSNAEGSTATSRAPQAAEPADEDAVAGRRRRTSAERPADEERWSPSSRGASALSWPPETRAAERRASAFLARRGHDWQTIRRVLAAVAGGEAESPRTRSDVPRSLTLSAQRRYTLLVCDERSRRVPRPYS